MGISLIAYPFVVFIGLKYYSLKTISIILLSLFVLRMLLVKKGDQISLIMGMMGLCLMIASLLFKQQELMLYYPFLISVLLLIIFVTSLIKPPTIIEKIARLMDKDFNDKAIPYVEKVTFVWSTFFLLNGCISAYTIYRQDLELWTLYNGLISYLIMGLIFAVEFVVRMRVKKSHESGV